MENHSVQDLYGEFEMVMKEFNSTVKPVVHDKDGDDLIKKTQLQYLTAATSSKPESYDPCNEQVNIATLIEE